MWWSSLVREMMKKAQELNITYHPFLDNFPEFDDVPRTEFNESLKFVLASALSSGIYWVNISYKIPSLIFQNKLATLTVGLPICKVPCVTVEYKMALDKYSLPSDEVTALAGGPNRGICWIQLSRFVQFENVSEESYFLLTILCFNTCFLNPIGSLYCPECWSPLWSRGCHGTLAGLVSAVSRKLHCEGIENSD